MKNIPQALLDHYRRPLTTIAHCWRIHLHDGTKILGTSHDRDLTITVTNAPRVAGTPFADLTGVYRRNAGIRFSDIRSSSDMSVDNTEAEGALVSDMAIPDLTVARIESGVADGAPVIAFKINWQDPDAGQDPVNVGFLGNFERDSSGRYRTEIRSLEQRLAQNIVRTYSERCDVVRFGDERCGYNLESARRSGHVLAVEDRRRFVLGDLIEGDLPPLPYAGGLLRFESGANAGFEREIKRAMLDAQTQTVAIELWEEMPAEVEIGDVASATPGCDRTPVSCKLFGRFTTNPGWQGYGIFIPGALSLMAGPNLGLGGRFDTQVMSADAIDWTLALIWKEYGEGPLPCAGVIMTDPGVKPIIIFKPSSATSGCDPDAPPFQLPPEATFKPDG